MPVAPAADGRLSQSLARSPRLLRSAWDWFCIPEGVAPWSPTARFTFAGGATYRVGSDKENIRNSVWPTASETCRTTVMVARKVSFRRGSPPAVRGHKTSLQDVRKIATSPTTTPFAITARSSFVPATPEPSTTPVRTSFRHWN